MGNMGYRVKLTTEIRTEFAKFSIKDSIIDTCIWKTAFMFS